MHQGLRPRQVQHPVHAAPRHGDARGSGARARAELSSTRGLGEVGARELQLHLRNSKRDQAGLSGQPCFLVYLPEPPVRQPQEVGDRVPPGRRLHRGCAQFLIFMSQKICHATSAGWKAGRLSTNKSQFVDSLSTNTADLLEKKNQMGLTKAVFN